MQCFVVWHDLRLATTQLVMFHNLKVWTVFTTNYQVLMTSGATITLVEQSANTPWLSSISSIIITILNKCIILTNRLVLYDFTIHYYQWFYYDFVLVVHLLLVIAYWYVRMESNGKLSGGSGGYIVIKFSDTFLIMLDSIPF